ncbi:MAG: hypothetical protein ABIJ09_02770 [Pseudomonadota bacterium]
MSASREDTYLLNEGYELEPLPEGLHIRTTDSRPLPVCIPWEFLRQLQSQGVLTLSLSFHAGHRPVGVTLRGSGEGS